MNQTSLDCVEKGFSHSIVPAVSLTTHALSKFPAFKVRYEHQEEMELSSIVLLMDESYTYLLSNKKYKQY